MAVHAIIVRMQAAGLHATQELGEGKWCHTPEYFKHRYGTRSGKAATDTKPAQVVKPSSTFSRILKRLEQELTPTERALLIARLEAE